MNDVDPMARQMARLLVGSDLDELREILERFRREAPSEALRRQYDAFGHKLLELKAALAEQPTPPTLEELEVALTLMLRLAASHGPSPR